MPAQPLTNTLPAARHTAWPVCYTIQSTMKYSSLLPLFLLLACTACDSGEPAPADKGQDPSAQASDTAQDTSATASKEGQQRIVFFGNSLTAAYGLDPSEGFVALIQQRIDSLGLPYRTVNAGLSGETTAGGNERVGWILKQPIHIFVLELGGNDGLRGIDPAESYRNLEAIIQQVQAGAPQVRIVLAGMEAPPNMGDRFTRDFRGIYPRLAKAYQLPLIPFILDGVGGISSLNLPDGIHPNVEGQKIVAENVWAALFPLLQ